MARDLLPHIPNINKGNDLLPNIHNAQQNAAPNESAQGGLNPAAMKIAEFLQANPNMMGAYQKASSAFEGPQKFIEKYLAPANEAFESTGIPDFAGGALQGLANTAISIGNVPLGLAEAATGGNYQVPHFDYQRESGGPSTAFEIGELASPFFVGGGALKAAGNIARPSGYMGILNDILRGTGIGYATGQTKEGDRDIGALIGGITGGISGSSSGQIAKRLKGKTDDLRSYFEGQYKNVFKDASESGVKSIKKPQIDLESIMENSSPKYHSALQKFEANPTFENAHRAQSDLGKFASHLGKLERNNPLTSEQHRALKEAIDAQKRIRGSIFQSLSNSKNPELAQKYSEITNEYAKEAIPYFRNKNINDFLGGKISDKTLVNRLRNDDEFLGQMGQRHPEINLNKYLGKGAKYGAGIGAAATGGVIGSRLFDNYLGKR